jgi:hypothetical protein
MYVCIKSKPLEIITNGGVYNMLELVIKEEKAEYKSRVQLDEIMKKLFYIHNNRPIIDFLNSLYGDNLDYDAVVTYLNKEVINEAIYKKAVLVSQECDMLIRVDSNGTRFEYLLEFQTKNDNSISIRLFRYSFELKVQNLRYLNTKIPIEIELPAPYVIVLEENKNVPETYELILKTHTGEKLKYSSKVLKYWKHDLDNLYKNNMYLLFPLKVFGVRKNINKVKGMNEDNPRFGVLIKEIRDDILKVTTEILEHINLIYNEKKIDASEYNEFGVVISNLTMYLFQEIHRLESIEEEVNTLVKTFYDPEVEKRGEAKGEERGILKTKREVVLELLDDIGIISEDIKALVQKETDLELLKKWHKLAARAQSIEDFRNKIGLH